MSTLQVRIRPILLVLSCLASFSVALAQTVYATTMECVERHLKSKSEFGMFFNALDGSNQNAYCTVIKDNNIAMGAIVEAEIQDVLGRTCDPRWINSLSDADRTWFWGQMTIVAKLRQRMYNELSKRGGGPRPKESEWSRRAARDVAEERERAKDPVKVRISEIVRVIGKR